MLEVRHAMSQAAPDGYEQHSLVQEKHVLTHLQLLCRLLVLNLCGNSTPNGVEKTFHKECKWFSVKISEQNFFNFRYFFVDFGFVDPA